MTTRFKDGGGWETEAGYSRAVRRGGRIEVSGTTALAGEDTFTQTEAALLAALNAVEALGGKLAHVVRTRVFLAPDADWEAASRAHRQIMGAVAPANTMLYVHNLIGEGFLVEVELEAEVIE